jgi:hypothetical protein
MIPKRLFAEKLQAASWRGLGWPVEVLVPAVRRRIFRVTRSEQRVSF